MDVIDTGVRAEIEALVAEYSWRLDHAAWSTLPGLCVPDLRMTMGGHVLEGVDGLSAWAEQRAKTPERRTHHQTTNLRLYPNADPDELRGDVMLVLHVSTNGGPSSIEFVGEYRDRYVRTDKGWRFASRDVVPITAP